ncbi:MAG: glutathione S-transferase family protein [Granulosicoccus sp.]|nr:glutathione S-transferase family protein [Granulosicoccus sp.]
MATVPILYVTQGSGNSFKPMLVATQVGKHCRVRYIDVLAGETRQEKFLSVNPAGVVPYLTLSDGKGLGESNAIAWYLAEGTPLIPSTALGRAQAISWMNFEQTSLESNISPVRFFTYIVPDKAAEHRDMLPRWRDQGSNALIRLNNYLKNRDFITDDGYSVADVAVFGYTHLADEGGFQLSAFPAITQWIERVENQPGYRSINDLLNPDIHEIAA